MLQCTRKFPYDVEVSQIGQWRGARGILRVCCVFFSFLFFSSSSLLFSSHEGGRKEEKVWCPNPSMTPSFVMIGCMTRTPFIPSYWAPLITLIVSSHLYFLHHHICGYTPPPTPTHIHTHTHTHTTLWLHLALQSTTQSCRSGLRATNTTIFASV